MKIWTAGVGDNMAASAHTGIPMTLHSAWSGCATRRAVLSKGETVTVFRWDGVRLTHHCVRRGEDVSCHFGTDTETLLLMKPGSHARGVPCAATSFDCVVFYERKDCELSWVNVATLAVTRLRLPRESTQCQCFSPTAPQSPFTPLIFLLSFKPF